MHLVPSPEVWYIDIGCRAHSVFRGSGLDVFGLIRTSVVGVVMLQGSLRMGFRSKRSAGTATGCVLGVRAGGLARI